MTVIVSVDYLLNTNRSNLCGEIKQYNVIYIIVNRIR